MSSEEIEANYADWTAPEEEARPLSQEALILQQLQRDVKPELAGLNREQLQEKQEQLGSAPFIRGQYAGELLRHASTSESRAEMAPIEKILGTESPSFRNWSDEYESRRGQVVDVARQLLHPTEAVVERVFHAQRLYDQRRRGHSGEIFLDKIVAPAGPIYLARDGTHRVAAAKLAEVKQIPALVETLKDVQRVNTTDPIIKQTWEDRIKLRLLEGTITATQSEQGAAEYQLDISSRRLPWAHLSNEAFCAFNRAYQSAYPEALSELSIAPEVLTDSFQLLQYTHPEYFSDTSAESI